MPNKAIFCHDCGTPGLEDPDDPCPGLCPTCFERRLAEATLLLQRAPTQEHALAILRKIGLSETGLKVARQVGIIR